MNSVDILVSNGTVLAMDQKNTRIRDGAVAIRGDQIISVGNASDFSGWRSSLQIDAQGVLSCRDLSIPTPMHP